jgi:PmbA protein
MDKGRRLDLAEWAAEFAIQKGASQVAVDLTNQRVIDIQYRDGALEKLEESTSNSMSLDIYVEKRYSSHSTSDLNQDSLKRFIEEAVAMTKFLTIDEYRMLPDPKYYKGQKKMDLQILDPGYAKLNSQNRVEFAEAIQQVAAAQGNKIISTTAYYSDTQFETVKVQSNGFTGDKRGTIFTAGAEAAVRDEGGGRPEDWFVATTRFRKDLPTADVLGRKASERALRKIGQTKIDSGKYDMLLENRSGRRLLGALLGPMSARSLQQKSSFLEGKLDQQIASPLLTIEDDPFLEGGLGSRLYDGEGLAAKRLTLIEKGQLKSYFVDTYYGKKLGMEPTTASSSNLVFKYGEDSLDDLVKGTEKGILVTSFIGGNSNPTTGDFSYGIIGMLVEKGKVVKPVNEMNISGNIGDLLKRLVAVGNDPYPYSSVRIPSLRFEAVNFSGI